MGELKAPLGPTAIHLCIDMQRLFAPGGPWPTPWMERVLPNVIHLVERAPSRTVFTRFIPPRSPGDVPGMWQTYYRKWQDVTLDRLDTRLLDLMPALQNFMPPARAFNRMQYSAFANGQLHRLLRRRNIDTIIVTGSETDVCVLSSVLMAVDLGYRVIIARDGTCSSSDETHDALLSLYRRRFEVQIELSDVTEIVETWRAEDR
jgi:nicotinamidase-related amidase